MDRKLWIIGDSFTMVDAGRYGENSWPKILCKSFKGKDYYVSSMGSRDIETIFDIFLENLYRINSDDFVILMLPTLTRFRLPLANGQATATYCSDLDKNYPYNYMIGGINYTAQVNNSPNAPNKEEHKKSYMLEWPLNEIDPMAFRPNENVKESPTIGNIMQMINSSKAFANNWNSKLKSIQSYIPFKLLYYSWENELDSSIVNTKNLITNQLGIWETLEDIYHNTNGEKGNKGDAHWSEDMNIKFAEHIIKSYPQHFSYVTKTF
jgi:hypothetical protein